MSKTKKHFVRMLEEYGYQKALFNKYFQLSNEYEQLIKQEMGIKSKSFDSVPIHNPSDYVKELIHEQYTYQLAWQKARDEMNRIKKAERFDERFEVLNDIEKQIIQLRYFECMSQDKVAKIIKYCDRSYISKKEEKAINKMLRAKID